MKRNVEPMREFALPTGSVISIIDDDEPHLESMTSLMKSLGFRVEAFSSAAAFLASPHLNATCCLIADINMPHMTGVELHGRLVRSGSAIPTILITAYPDDNTRARAKADGVVCYLTKPCAEDQLLACVRSALKRGNWH